MYLCSHYVQLDPQHGEGAIDKETSVIGLPVTSFPLCFCKTQFRGSPSGGSDRAGLWERPPGDLPGPL